MGAPQFATQVDNSTTNNSVLTEAEVTANTANQMDIDLLTEDISSGYSTGETNISGAKELALGLNSQDSNSFSVTVEWTNGAGNVLDTDQPSEWQGTTSASGLVVVKSTHVNVKITGTSTSVNGTVNAH